MLEFIVKLLLLRELLIEVEYNSIIVITNKITKYKYFILYKEANTTKDLVYTFLRTIISNYNILDEIISNRDKLFILNF